MEDEQLIELVRAQPVLYDTTNSKYVDAKYKIHVWNDIGRELNATGAQCKTRWANIRDHFRRHLAKRQRTSYISGDRTNVKRNKYKHEDALEFLIPHFSDLPVASQHNNADYSGGGLSPKNDLDELPRTHSPTEDQQETEKLVCTPSLKKSFPVAESSSSFLIQYLIEKQENQHPVDAFLVGIASSMKRFSPQNQLCAKRKIFSIIHELEEQELMNLKYE